MTGKGVEVEIDQRISKIMVTLGVDYTPVRAAPARTQSAQQKVEGSSTLHPSSSV
jgi:hypothetical protein